MWFFRIVMYLTWRYDFIDNIFLSQTALLFPAEQTLPSRNHNILWGTPPPPNNFKLKHNVPRIIFLIFPHRYQSNYNRIALIERHKRRFFFYFFFIQHSYSETWKLRCIHLRKIFIDVQAWIYIIHIHKVLVSYKNEWLKHGIVA